MRSIVRDVHHVCRLISQNLDTRAAGVDVTTYHPRKTYYVDREKITPAPVYVNGHTNPERNVVADVASTWWRRISGCNLRQELLLEHIEREALEGTTPVDALTERLVEIAAERWGLREETTTDFADYTWEDEPRFALPWGDRRLAPVEKVHALIAEVCDRGDARARRVAEFKKAIEDARMEVWLKHNSRTELYEACNRLADIAHAVTHENKSQKLEDAVRLLKEIKFLKEADELAAFV